MKNTIVEYDSIIKNCKDIFAKKMKDYGSAWRILRISSLTDQIFIKAQRIRSIEQKGFQKVEEGARNEFIGIVNYAVIGLIQLDIGVSEQAEEMDYDKAISNFEKNIKTAKECILEGADMINDISAGNIDKDIFKVIAKYNVPYIIMHMKGTPKNMQDKPEYNNIVDEIIEYFIEKITTLNSIGIKKIIIDPGFGFGKTLNHNFKILNNLDKLKHLKHPILVGVSRKSMIYNLLKTTPHKALNGTSVLNTIALSKGANILRVHDVKEAIECIKISTFAKNNF